MEDNKAIEWISVALSEISLLEDKKVINKKIGTPIFIDITSAR